MKASFFTNIHNLERGGGGVVCACKLLLRFKSRYFISQIKWCYFFQNSELLMIMVNFQKFHIYEDFIYISGIINKSKYLSLKMGLLFFKIFSVMMHTFEQIFIALFSFRSRYFQNMHFEHINCFFWHRKSLITQFILHKQEQKEIIGYV